MKVVAIGAKEDDEKASLWSDEHKLTYPVAIDAAGEIYKKYGTGSVPYHAFIDRNFKVRLSQENFAKDAFIDLIRNNLAIS